MKGHNLLQKITLILYMQMLSVPGWQSLRLYLTIALFMRTRQNIFREKIVPLFLLKYFGDPLWSKLKIDHPANTAYMYPASDLTKKKVCTDGVFQHLIKENEES